ncbi:MAG: hypothetical protein Q9191_005983 [Dirinaria sp. TL-2023a]
MHPQSLLLLLGTLALVSLGLAAVTPKNATGFTMVTGTRLIAEADELCTKAYKVHKVDDPLRTVFSHPTVFVSNARACCHECLSTPDCAAAHFFKDPSAHVWTHPLAAPGGPRHEHHCVLSVNRRKYDVDQENRKTSHLCPLGISYAGIIAVGEEKEKKWDNGQVETMIVGPCWQPGGQIRFYHTPDGKITP